MKKKARCDVRIRLKEEVHKYRTQKCRIKTLEKSLENMASANNKAGATTAVACDGIGDVRK